MAEWRTSLRQRIRASVRRRRLEQDLQEEMTFHLAMSEAQLQASGAADAGRDARRRFGSPVHIREEMRDVGAVPAAVTETLPAARDISVDGRVLAFSASSGPGSFERYERRTFAPEAVSLQTRANTILTWVYGPYLPDARD